LQEQYTVVPDTASYSNFQVESCETWYRMLGLFNPIVIAIIHAECTTYFSKIC